MALSIEKRPSRLMAEKSPHIDIGQSYHAASVEHYTAEKFAAIMAIQRNMSRPARYAVMIAWCTFSCIWVISLIMVDDDM